MIVLTVLFVLLALSIIAIIYGICTGSEGWWASGIFAAILIGIPGCVVYGFSTDHTTRTLLRRDQYEIFRGKDYIIYAKSEDLKITNDLYSVVSNPENMNVYEVTEYSHYNTVEDKSPYLELEYKPLWDQEHKN